LGDWHFEKRTGRTVRSDASSILFLWKNWHVLYRLNPGRIRCEQVSEGIWSARGMGGAGHIHLIRCQASRDRGELEFFSMMSFMMMSFKMTTFLRFNRGSDGLLSYEGHAFCRFPRLLRPLHWFLRMLAGRATDYVYEIGGATAERLYAKDPADLEKLSGSEKRLYREMVDEESGATETVKHFTETSETPKGTERSDLETRIEALEARLGDGSDGLSIGEMKKAMAVYSSDPLMALVKNRTIVEHITRVMLESETDHQAGTRTLGPMIDLLAKDAPRMPSSIIALMRTVTHLGNVGGHAISSSDPRSKINLTEFTISMTATIRIVEWFFTERGLSCE